MRRERDALVWSGSCPVLMANESSTESDERRQIAFLTLFFAAHKGRVLFDSKNLYLHRICFVATEVIADEAG